MQNGKLNIALVGVGFGSAFIPIYHVHPDVASIRIYDTNRALCEEFLSRGVCDGIYDSFEEILADETCDAVHLVTPIPCHAEQTVRVLESGKHSYLTIRARTSAS